MERPPFAPVKIQLTEQRELNDIQVHLKKQVETLNSGPLSIDSLDSSHENFTNPAWAALGSDASHPLKTSNHREVLERLVFVPNVVISASNVDYRQLNFYRYRNGQLVATLGLKTTMTEGFTSNKIFEIPLAGQADTTFEINDSLIFFINGGGTKPAFGGAITSYWRKL